MLPSLYPLSFITSFSTSSCTHTFLIFLYSFFFYSFLFFFSHFIILFSLYLTPCYLFSLSHKIRSWLLSFILYCIFGNSSLTVTWQFWSQLWLWSLHILSLSYLPPDYLATPSVKLAHVLAFFYEQLGTSWRANVIYPGTFSITFINARFLGLLLGRSHIKKKKVTCLCAWTSICLCDILGSSSVLSSAWIWVDWYVNHKWVIVIQSALTNGYLSLDLLSQ